MPDTPTAWAGIIVRTAGTDSKLFDGLVVAALAKIASKPVGNQLLTDIAAQVAKVKFGFTVCIKPKALIKQTFGPFIQWRVY